MAISTLAEADPGKDEQGWTLNELAARINKALDDASAADDMANDRRIAAGKMLKIAKAKVAHGYFKKWCERNIKRSRADVYRCLALVGEDDPFKQREAREAEKAKARVAMAASRERKAIATVIPVVSNVGDTTPVVSAQEPVVQVERPKVVTLSRAPRDAVDRLENLFLSFKAAWQKAYDAEVSGVRDGVAQAWKLAGEAFDAIYRAA